MSNLDPETEANLLTYILLFDFCKSKCRKNIGDEIKKKAKTRKTRRTTKIVYRGHSSKAKTIKTRGFHFFSTTPNKQMAESFVEKDWDKPESSQRIGHLFKIHLVNVPTLSTRNVEYSLNSKVLTALQKIIKNKKIQKGSGTYTLEEYIPKMREAIDDLVMTDSAGNGEEILVPTGGTFYKDPLKSRKGFKPIGNRNYETWYFYE